jgi:DedD protein
MADDGFHEIQLGKKQLVFLFMAAAVFSVVVFLMGVWVGREVRRPDGEIVSDVPMADNVSPDAQQPPTQVAPDELDYTARLQTEGAKTEPAKQPETTTRPIEPPTPVESGPPEPQVATPPPAAAAPVKTPSQTPAAKAAASTVVLQVGAFGTQGPADTLMNRLKRKGYEAYVFVAPTGQTRFKVRVGPFANRAEADRASARLTREEGLSPLVQR